MSYRAPGVVTTIGIDIGKNSFHLIGLDGVGAIEPERKRTSLLAGLQLGEERTPLQTLSNDRD